MRILCTPDAGLGVLVEGAWPQLATPEPQPPEPGDPVPVNEPDEEHEEHEDDLEDEPPQEAA